MDSFKESILTLNYAKKFKVSKNISIIDNKKKQISDIKICDNNKEISNLQ